MEKDFLIKTKNLSENCERMVQRVEKEIEKMPEGKLWACRRGKSICFYHHNDITDTTRYLGSQISEEVRMFAQKEFYQLSLKEYMEISRILNNTALRLEKVMEEKDPMKKINPLKHEAIDPSIMAYLTDSFWNQTNASYCDKKKMPFETKKGDFVRSKTEREIANDMYDKRVPYLYERKLRLHNGIIVYPDFTILRRTTGEILIWEHYGRMDDPKYAEIAIRKNDDYQYTGYKLGEGFIFTEETSDNPLRTEKIRYMIDTYCL
ncbi:MAG: hypothetical protein K5634_01950 [Sphaerochaetaceae bacterium]|nr:hypothetical protein [Sphaerochaetaceae bacterium]